MLEGLGQQSGGNGAASFVICIGLQNEQHKEKGKSFKSF